MSASSKKKLRNAEKAEQLTQRQQAERAEATKLKILTVVMVVVLIATIAVAAVIAVQRIIKNDPLTNSGILQRNTVAMTVGEHEISAVELNYFYVDAVNQFYSNYGSYASLFGLDVTKPLNEQVADPTTGATWADDFLSSAQETIKAVYAITDEANANGFTLSEADKAEIETQMQTLEMYAVLYAGSDVDGYLTALYGPGASEKTIRAYYEKCYLAQAYQDYIKESLTYTDAELAAKDEENPSNYTSYSYNSYYLSTSKFLSGGTTDAEGNTTYSDDEKAAAVIAAEDAAKKLTAEEITSIEALDAAIAGLDINAEVSNAASTAYEDYRYSNIGSVIQEWVSDESRQAGDLEYIASTTTADDGTETVNGYYVVYYVGSNTNEYTLIDVRHILAKFEGGTTDENGTTTYTDEEKAAAKAVADELLAEWKAGEATEDSFAALANEHSDDGDGTTGGLYTDVYRGQMVTNFENWCYAEERQPGDTGIVETEFGYHVMYFVGDSEHTYRDYLIIQDLVSADVNDWYNTLVGSVTLTVKETKYIPGDLVLSAT